MRKYDRAGHHVHTESSLGASIDYSHDKDGNLSEMNSGGWSARWQRDRVGLETERELTGGVHVRTHHDSLGRETYKSVGARNVEQFRRSYIWGISNRLHATEDGLTGRRVRYDYDEFDNLLSAEYKQGNDVERIYRIPDRIGNLFETREKDDRKYGAGSRLTEDRDYFYHYDCEGNLVFKEFRTLDWAGLSVSLGVQRTHLEEELGITFRAFGAGWRYDWQSDGMLSRVVRPDSKEVSFAYDALGRRTEKTYEGVATHFVWDGNVPLHEWQEVSSDAEKTNITTWLFEQNTFIPAAKLAANGESFSIVSDYLGTPLQAFDNNGNKVWEQELDIFGRKRTGNNNSSFIPFKYQGQYEDVETGLYYNRFRYYDPRIGNYISQDLTRLMGNNPTLYGYVGDLNKYVDVWGLSDCKLSSDFKNGASFLIPGDSYEQFVKNSSMVGRPDGQFVSPSNQIDDLLKKANGDISIIEEALGIPKGGWQGKGGMYRIDISNPQNYNLRSASSGISGANNLFIAGGKTSGGISEGIIDQVPKGNVTITRIIK